MYKKRKERERGKKREEEREGGFIEMQERRTWQRDTKIEYEI